VLPAPNLRDRGLTELTAEGRPVTVDGVRIPVDLVVLLRRVDA